MNKNTPRGRSRGRSRRYGKWKRTAGDHTLEEEGSAAAARESRKKRRTSPASAPRRPPSARRLQAQGGTLEWIRAFGASAWDVGQCGTPGEGDGAAATARVGAGGLGGGDVILRLSTPLSGDPRGQPKSGEEDCCVCGCGDWCREVCCCNGCCCGGCCCGGDCCSGDESDEAGDCACGWPCCCDGDNAASRRGGGWSRRGAGDREEECCGEPSCGAGWFDGDACRSCCFWKSCCCCCCCGGEPIPTS